MTSTRGRGRIAKAAFERTRKSPQCLAGQRAFRITTEQVRFVFDGSDTRGKQAARTVVAYPVSGLANLNLAMNARSMDGNQSQKDRISSQH